LNGHEPGSKSQATNSSVLRLWSMISNNPTLLIKSDCRLFNLVAEDLAIEDTMEILAKALDYERITLDAFLKVPFFLVLGADRGGNEETCEGAVPH
jgi:Vps23 core domain